MKKILTTVVMLCLLCAMLLPVGAFASHEAWPTLSEDLCQEIASKYAIQYHQDAAAVERILVCCVGEYDGMYLCGIGDYWNQDGPVDTFVNTTIGDYTIRHRWDTKLVVYNQGELLKLEEAWDAGWLTMDIVKQMKIDWDSDDSVPAQGDTALIPVAIALLISGTGLALLAIRRKKHFA